MAGWLEGITVVDLSWGMAGPLATMWLCDYGAEVVRVEPAGGDPYWREPGSLLWNRGKKSVTLDLESLKGSEAARALASRADVLIQCYKPGEADRLGLGYNELARLNPRLIYCAIPSFGSKGPYAQWPQYEEVVAAKMGIMAAIIGWYGDRPVYKSLPLGSYGAAALAVQGILTALHVRESTGRGQYVEASLADGLASYQGARARYHDQALNAEARERAVFQRHDARHINPGVRMCECSDGKWIQLGAAQNDFFLRLLLCIGLEEATRDPRFANWPRQIFEEDGFDIIYKIEERIRTQPRAYWAKRFDEMDIPYALPQTTAEFLDDPQVRHLGLVVEVDDPRVGCTEQLGKWFDTVGGDWRIKGPAPLPGQHNDEVLGTLDQSPAITGIVPPVSPPPALPLEGITILDLANWISAPIGIKYLADLGAEVIKVEPPGGEAFRQVRSDHALWSGRGKRGIAVSLKSDKGREIVHKLVERADVIVHNFRPGAPERLGVDYETLKAINPQLIYCYAASFGSTGPYAMRPAYGPLLAAITGSEVAQSGEGNPPQYVNEGDPTASLAVPVAILMALYRRDRTGEGQQVETRMLITEAYLNSEDAIRYPGRPKRRIADKEQLGLEALYRLYQAKDNTWVFLACATDSEWNCLCQALGLSDIQADDRFQTAHNRRQRSVALAHALEPLFREKTAQEWEDLLIPRGVACVVAHRHFVDVFFDDPHYRENGMVAEMTHPAYGRYEQVGMLVHLSETPGRIRRSSPYLGEHTREILGELGYSEEETEKMIAEKVVQQFEGEE